MVTVAERAARSTCCLSYTCLNSSPQRGYQVARLSSAKMRGVCTQSSVDALCRRNANKRSFGMFNEEGVKKRWEGSKRASVVGCPD